MIKLLDFFPFSTSSCNPSFFAGFHSGVCPQTDRKCTFMDIVMEDKIFAWFILV